MGALFIKRTRHWGLARIEIEIEARNQDEEEEQGNTFRASAAEDEELVILQPNWINFMSLWLLGKLNLYAHKILNDNTTAFSLSPPLYGSQILAIVTQFEARFAPSKRGDSDSVPPAAGWKR